MRYNVGNRYKIYLKYIYEWSKVMKVAVVGSRNLSVRNLGEYLPSETTEIISGGARGVDTSVREYANAHGIPLTEILPDYKKYPGKIAPLKRNIEIIERADLVLAFWNGESHGTKFVIDNCRKLGKRVIVYKPKN